MADGATYKGKNTTWNTIGTPTIQYYYVSAIWNYMYYLFLCVLYRYNRSLTY